MTPPVAHLLSDDQALKLVAICAMLKDGDLSLRADDDADAQAARETLIDIGEECALQIGGLSA